ncbi:MAG: FAD-linked oxidase C-terminal domain-containing protein, partial [Nocardioidaceae bacterium]
VYETGASLYFTVAARQVGDGLAQWAAAKHAASEAIRAAGATITHHHAVGRDHRPWLAGESGPVGVEMLRAV